MNLRLRVAALLFLLLTSLPLFATNKIAHRWILAGAPVLRVQRMLVVRIGENFLVRQQFEDEMKRLLAVHGVEGVQSYLFLPPKNDMMEGELKQRIKESSLDSILVIRAKAALKETDARATSVAYAPPSSYSNFWPFWNMAYGDPGPVSPDARENSLVRVEFNLFSTKDEKLVWSGETGVLKCKDFDRAGNVYARALVNQLKKDRIMRKK